MIFLACADSLENERLIALLTAFVAAIIFAILRPSFEEWKLSCTRRTIFYFFGAILFLLIGFTDKMKAVDVWQDMNSFVLYFKIAGTLLYIKWIISCALKNKYKYENKLINDYKMSFLGKL